MRNLIERTAKEMVGYVEDTITKAYLETWLGEIEGYLLDGRDFDRLYREFLPTVDFLTKVNLGTDAIFVVNTLYRLQRDLHIMMDTSTLEYCKLKEMNDSLIGIIELKH